MRHPEGAPLTRVPALYSGVPVYRIPVLRRAAGGRDPHLQRSQHAFCLREDTKTWGPRQARRREAQPWTRAP